MSRRRAEGSRTPAGGVGGEVPDGEAAGEAGGDLEPCLRCAVAIPARLMGCKGGHCPNCGYPYPHGDCSD